MASIFRRPRPAPERPTALTTAQPYRPGPPAQPRRGPAAVTAESMMSLPTMFAAMSALSGIVASLPVTDRDGNPRDVAPPRDPRTKPTLWQQPTEHDTWFTFIDALDLNLIVHGNAFAVPVEVNYATGAICRLELVHPSLVVPMWRRSGLEASFAVGAWIDGQPHGPADFLHFRLNSEGGYAWGLSRLRMLAAEIAIQLSEQAHVRSTYEDGATPSGYLHSEQTIDPDELAQAANRFADDVAGRGAGVPALGRGLRWEQTTLNHDDLELLAARQWSSTVACQIVGIPPHLVGAATYDSETYANVRSDMELFNQVTLARHRRAIGPVLQRHGIDTVLGEPDLARPDFAARAQGYAAAGVTGWMDVDEVRDREGLPQRAAPDTPPAAAAGRDGDVTAAIDDDLDRLVGA